MLGGRRSSGDAKLLSSARRSDSPSLLACTSEPPPQVPSADPATLRRLPAGEVVGRGGRYGGHAWLGLPYAEPPQGELRWRAPQPLLPWTGTREALAFGASCPQLASPIGGDDSAPAGTLVGSEDCLYLNVYAPAFAPGEVPDRRDAAAGDGLDPRRRQHDRRRAQLRRQPRSRPTHDRVVVMLNYRLGALGWLRHASLREGRERRRGLGQLRHARPDPRARVGARQHRAPSAATRATSRSSASRRAGRTCSRCSSRRSPAACSSAPSSQSGGTWASTPAEAEHLRDDPEPGHAQSSGEMLLALLQADGQAALRTRAATAQRQAALAAMPPAEVATFLRGQSVERLFAAYPGGARPLRPAARVPRRRGAAGRAAAAGDRAPGRATTRCRCCSAATATSRSCSCSSTRARCGAGSA